MDTGENNSKGTLAMDSDRDDHVADAGAEPASAYQLKVLAGRHSGAVMPLSPGRYSLGQDEESDFIFLDDAFLGGRVIVDVTGAEPTIEAVGQLKAVLDGRELVAGQPTPLPHYLPVEVGATRFAIGPSLPPWPEPAAPVPDPREAAAADAAVPRASGEGGVAPADADGRPDGNRAEAKAPAWAPGLRRPLRFAAVAAVAALAVLGGLASWWLYPRPAPVDHAAELRAILTRLNLPEAKVADGPGGLMVKGFIRTDAERDSLLGRLGDVKVPVGVELVSAEEIRYAIQGVLDLHHLGCTVTIGPGGRTAVACILENPGANREVSEALRQAVPPAAVLDIRLYPATEAFSFLNGQLSARVLDHKIHPELLEGRIGCVLVKGQMDSLETAAWIGIREAFQSKFGMDLEERWTERLSPVLQRFQNLARALDAQLVGVTVGEMSYITLKRRRKYFVGARLGGLTLKSIHDDRLVLSLDNVEQNYFLKKGKR